MEQSKLRRGTTVSIKPEKLGLIQKPDSEYTRLNSVSPIGRQNSAMRNSTLSGVQNEGLSPNFLNVHQRSENEGGGEVRPGSDIPINDA